MAERRRPPVPVIVLVVLALAGGGTWWWSTQQAAAQPARIAGSVEATQYAVASVISGKVAEVKVAGSDEVAQLASSFGRMRISLRKALAMLEQD